jgi:hypothetical protein
VCQCRLPDDCRFHNTHRVVRVVVPGALFESQSLPGPSCRACYAEAVAFVNNNSAAEVGEESHA